MKKKPRWANILCNRNIEPYLLIVTDGEWTTEIHVSNSKLATVKQTAKSVYSVPYNRMFVTQVINPLIADEGGN